MRFFGAFALALAMVQSAAAHFVWVDLDAKTGVARVTFGEDSSPGDKMLIGKIASTKTVVRTPGKSAQPLEMKENVDGDTAWYAAPVEAEQGVSVESVCNYGVLDRGGKTFQLKYYGKHISAGKSQLASLAKAESLPLDLVPSDHDGSLQITALWQGKPTAGVEILALGPDNKPQEVVTNKDGQVVLKSTTTGSHVLRGKFVQAEAGEADGKKYPETRHYSTLTLAVAEGETSAATSPATSATELLAQARASRMVWNEIPGFTADISIRTDGKLEDGKVRLSADGEADIKLPEGSPTMKWAGRMMSQMVEHRMPSGFGEERAEFADEEVEHPLGRLVRLNDKEHNSVYRVGNGVVTEVNRAMGKGKFTISVIEVWRNPEGKYAPQVFTVTFWDEAGAIQTSQTMYHKWIRVGGFDLPSELLEVSTLPGKREVRKVVFSNHKLLPVKKTAAK